MRILLYNPDNGVTRNFMPHLWMFLLQSLTPPGHEVLLIDGNAKPMDEAQIAQYVRDEKIDLVGIGAMTRMIAKAYRMADAIRATRCEGRHGRPARHGIGRRSSRPRRRAAPRRRRRSGRSRRNLAADCPMMPRAASSKSLRPRRRNRQRAQAVSLKDYPVIPWDRSTSNSSIWSPWPRPLPESW
jgi:hypothetical protein